MDRSAVPASRMLGETGVAIQSFWLTGVLTLAGCLDGTGPPWGMARPVPPDVLIVTLDTVRADAVPGFGGDPEALPNLAAWVDEGRRFTRAYTVAPLTLPAHASLFTGRMPAEHGIRTQEWRSRAGLRLDLVEAARSQGYRTVAVVALGMLADLARATEAFDEVHFSEAQPAAGAGLLRGENERPAAEVIANAVSVVGKAALDRPLFLWVHLFDAHYPYTPAGVSWNLCPVEARPSARRLTRTTAVLNCLSPPMIPAPGPFWGPCLRDLYTSEIQRIDDLLPLLREAVRDRGEPVWALLADHGECIGEEGQWARHGGLLLECAVRIPLVFGGAAAFVPGDERQALASIVDVAPTLAATLGWPLRGPAGGDPGPSEPERAGVFFEGAGLALPGCPGASVGAWRDDEKVVLSDADRTPRFFRRAGDAVVPMSVAEASSTIAGVADRLSRPLPAWPPRGSFGGPRSDVPPLLTSDNEQALRALGYVAPPVAP